MTIYGMAMAIMITVLSFWMPVFFSDEGREQAKWDATQQDFVLFYAYSNYVRSVVGKAQSDGSLPDTRPLTVETFGYGTNGVPVIRGETPEYILKKGVERLNLGNVMDKNDKGVDMQYVWMNPDDLDAESMVRKAFGREPAMFYFKRGNRLVVSNRPEEFLELGNDVVNHIPDGAMVFINKPVEHGATPHSQE